MVDWEQDRQGDAVIADSNSRRIALECLTFLMVDWEHDRLGDAGRWQAGTGSGTGPEPSSFRRVLLSTTHASRCER